MKRTVSFLLALLMLASLFVFTACDDKKPPVTDDGGKQNGTENNGGDELGEDMKVTLSDEKPDIPEDLRFDGEDFVIFAPTPYGIERFCPEAPNGEPVVDAVYNSNLAVTDDLGVTIKTIDKGAYTHNQAEYIIDDVLSGNHSFDIAAIHSTSACAALIIGKSVLSFDNLEYCDLSKPWWIKGMTESASLFDKVYFGVSSSCYVYYSAAACLLFNKDLAEEHNAPDIYELVRRGEWTVDKLIEITKNFSKDLNNDGMYDYNDKLAIVSNSYSVNSWLGGFRQATVEKSDTDGLEIVVNSNRMTTVVEKLNSLYHSGRRGHIIEVNSPDKEAYDAAFAEGRVLFMTGSGGSATSFRDYDINFGIVPLPKLNSDQESYGSWVDPWHLTLCVPIDCPDTERVSAVLETMAYHSYRNVYPAVVEQQIFGTGTRDVESLEMLEKYIFPNVYFEFGYLFDSWGVGFGNILRDLVENNSTDIASYFGEKRNSAQNHYDSLYEEARALADEF